MCELRARGVTWDGRRYRDVAGTALPYREVRRQIEARSAQGAAA